MLYLYAARPSQSAKDLVEGLGASRLRHFDGLSCWTGRKRVTLTSADRVICWGSFLPSLGEDIPILNAGLSTNKFLQLRTLATSGIATPPAAASKFSSTALPRLKFHSGGSDLLTPPEKPEFWVEKLPFVSEYRIHSFAGKSIRAGVKVPREGFREVPERQFRPGAGLVHPWIRSFDAGWRVQYDGFRSDKKMRVLAHAAVKTLGLTFGAVDIGKLSNGTYLVLEVNTAPGLEGGTLTAYIKRLTEWAANPWATKPSQSPPQRELEEDAEFEELEPEDE